MANSTLEPAGSAPPPPGTKPSLAQALRSIFSKSEEADQGKVIARRRKFVMAAVLGTLSVNLLMFFFFFSVFFVRTEGQVPHRIPLGFRLRGGYQTSEPVPHLGGAQYRGRLRDLGDLHAPGLHAGLEAEREQVQVPVPRQRLRSRRHQFRGSGAATHGPGACRTRSRGTDCGGPEPRLPVAQGRA